MNRFFICICVLLFFPLDCLAFDISATSALCLDADTGEVVYNKNGYQQMSPASTTKIMTALIALETCRLDEVVRVSDTAARVEGSSMYLKEDERITVENLLYGLMLSSGNDAATALAEHIAPDIERFARIMTKKAKLIGANNTNFENPSGLDGKAHYVTAYDLALITKNALENEDFRSIVSTTSIKIGERFLYNHNKLLSNYSGCIGVKTGYTMKSGRTLVSAAKRDGSTFIVVTLNAPDDWNDHTKILDHAFSTKSLQTTSSTSKEETFFGLFFKFLEVFLRLYNNS